jgi:hypothetical protein
VTGRRDDGALVVIIQRLDAETLSPGGVVIPHSAAEKPIRAKAAKVKVRSAQIKPQIAEVTPDDDEEKPQERMATRSTWAAGARKFRRFYCAMNEAREAV